MKKLLLVRKSTKRVGSMLVVAMLALGLTACGSTKDVAEMEAVHDTVAQNDSAASQGATGEQAVPEEMPQGNNFFGEITSIDDNTITVNVVAGGMAGGRPEGGTPEVMQAGEKPEGGTPEGMQAGEKPEGGAPEGMQGEKPVGEAPGGAEAAEKPTEAMTITLSEDTVITVDGETAELAQLQVGDIVSFTMDGDTVTAISVGMVDPGRM